MGEFRSQEVLPVNVLWSIRHINTFRVGTFLCILFMVFILLYFLILHEPLMLSLMAILMIFCISLNYMYNHTLKFADVVNALDIELNNVVVEKLNTLRFDSKSHGKFTLYHEDGGGYMNAHYKMWITTAKNLPIQADKDLDLWDRDTFYKRNGSNKDFPLPGYLSPSDVADIKSLKEIRFEWGPITNRLVATLDDRWLNSETSDILRTLKILRKIKKKLG